MSERFDEDLKRAASEAAGEPRGEVRARALEAMVAGGRERPASPLRRLPTALGAVLVVSALAFAPYSASSRSPGMQTALATQAFAAEALAASPEQGAGGQARRENLPEDLMGYAERAPEFVREHYPDDPEMLMAAALLTRDVSEAVRLSKAAVDRSGSGAAWAAYAWAVMETVPGYCRPANWPVDPGDREAVAEARREIAESGVPGALSPQAAAPVLDVLSEWQQVEPQNAAPIAVEVYYLYGLHRDEEALERWEEGALLPDVDSHSQEILAGSARLLAEMGMSPFDALSSSLGHVWRFSGISTFRASARIGLYEGRLARLEGRPEEAVRWWMATIEFGRHMQQSATTLIEYLGGTGMEGLGASPVWVWQRDSVTGIPGGPLLDGRLFYGPEHEFFVRVVGSDLDREIRDSRVRAVVHSMLAREYFRDQQALAVPQLAATILRGFSMWYAALLVVFLLVFVAVSLWARQKADEATSLGWCGCLIIGVLALAPVTAGFAITWFELGESGVWPGLAIVTFGGLSISLVAMLLVPLIAAFQSRRAEARLVTAWRGNLRRVLPIALVLLAVLSLGLGLAARKAAAERARDWMAETEMDRVVRAMGAEWVEPEIPPDAWRAEYPREAKS